MDYLQLDAWLCHCSERVGLPVDLFHLLPHNHVETGAVLVAEDETSVVIIRHRIDMKRPFKIHPAESSVTCGTDFKYLKGPRDLHCRAH